MIIFKHACALCCEGTLRRHYVETARLALSLRAKRELGQEALHTTDLTAFVGREEELELLLRRWSRLGRKPVIQAAKLGSFNAGTPFSQRADKAFQFLL